ncbi:Ionotropic glutamate receptor [Trinorchestia longiramus]|nr:Ionotropic glutamate receptor [Trinorchestia longiramus]
MAMKNVNGHFNKSHNKHTNKQNKHKNDTGYLTWVVHSLKSYTDGTKEIETVATWTKLSGLSVDRSFNSPVRKDFKGRTMILTTVHKPRVFDLLTPSGNRVSRLEDVGGYVPVLLSILKSTYNFTYQWTVTSDYGALRDGVWTGMSGDLIYKRADFAPLDYAVSPARLPYLDYTDWYSTDSIILVSQAPRDIDPPFLLLQIFSPLVSLGDKSESMKAVQCLEAAFQIVLLQGSRRWPVGIAGKSVSVCLLYVAVLLYAFYQGSVTAFLAVPRQSVPIETTDQLLEQLDHVTPVSRTNTFFWKFLEEHESLRGILAKLELFPDDYLNTIDFFRHVDSGKYILLDTVSSAAGRIANLEVRGELCRYNIPVRNPVVLGFDVMALPRNSPYKNPINHA